MFWSPLANPAVLIVTRSPETLSGAPFPLQSGAGTARDSSDGSHFVDDTAQLLVLPDIDPAAPLAALIPFDDDTLGRIDALTRVWRAWNGRIVPPDTRITSNQRRRLRLKIQAADGRKNGASYREIAIAIFGEARTAAGPWKTSSLRDTVIELVEGGIGLIAGGYLGLLRHRRRL